MKSGRFPFCLPVLCLIAIARPAGAQESTVVERGPHHAVIQSVLPDGTTNTFTHLQTGLNRWLEADRLWVPASDEVERVNGVALARKTQYQVIFGTTLNAPEGAVDILLADGRRLRARPTGIAYTEFQSGRSGKSVFVGEAQASAAEIAGRNEVTYANALTGIPASVRYRVAVSGLEQDIVLGSALPPPSEFQMNEALVRVEVWNEILESPAPEKQAGNIVRSDGSVDRDEQLLFGTMLFGSGSALDGRKSIRVARQWQEISGKVFLVESVPYSELKLLFASLPADSHERSVDSEKLRELWAKQSNRGRSLPVGGVVQREGRVARASAPSPRATGVVLDWTLLATATNFTFKGDTTYYVSNLVTLSATTNGATAIEGACVVKFTNSANAQIAISGPISCQSSAYRPAVFTSKDDNSVGETITGSSGTPTNFYGSGILVYNADTLHDLRFAFANTAVTVAAGQTLMLQDSQFVNCLNAFLCNSSDTLTLENNLFHNLDVLVTGLQNTTINGVNLTVHNCNTFSSLGTNGAVNLTNSLVVALGTSIQPAPSQAFSSINRISEPGVFVTVGAGSHYLQSSNICFFPEPGQVQQLRDAGTTDINPGLLARLSRKTTYAPVVLTNHFTTNTTLTPVVPRDDDGKIDIGFHFDPLDYLWTSLDVTNNSTLTLTNGVAVAGYGPQLIWLRGSSKVVSEGTVLNPNRLTTFHTVQEQPLALITNTALMTLINGANVTLRFTDVSVMTAGNSGRRLIPIGPFNATVSIQNSQLRGIYWYFYNWSTSGATTPTIHLTNSLLERCTIDWTQGYDITPFDPYYLYLAWYNNLFTRCSVTLRHYGSYYGSWDIYDNLFDNGSVTKSEYGQGKPNGSSLTTAGYNGFINTSDPFGGSGNKTGLLRDFQKSFLGDYYYPTNSITNSLSILVNAGSRTASSAGLTSYTTTTNQTADSGTVDIGYHSFAVSTNSTVTIQATVPVVSESGGLPGVFTVTRTGSTSSNLTVFYTVGGTAVPGTDYTALSGSATLGIGNTSQTINVPPITNNTVTFDKTVSAALILTNTYFVGSPGQATLLIQDSDTFTNVVPVATINGPMGIDYHSPSNSLIVSTNWTPNGFGPIVFKRVAISGAVSNWPPSGANLGDTTSETKLATVKVATNGWAVGDMYYGTGQQGKIGRITANGAGVFTNWATLTNATQGVGETNLLAGLYLDQTGVFGGNLIVVAGVASGGGGVWRVDSSTNATRITQINDANGAGVLLEGVVTVPNDVVKYGPWAGKILTCAEGQRVIYAIDVNGNATSYQLGLGLPEDVRLIPAPANQPLYLLDQGPNQVLKVPAGNFAAFAGDLLFVNEGGCPTKALFIVHWDGARFVVRAIAVGGQLEHAAFAPIDIPPLP
jgi:hypothetical protein